MKISTILELIDLNNIRHTIHNDNILKTIIKTKSKVIDIHLKNGNIITLSINNIKDIVKNEQELN